MSVTVVVTALACLSSAACGGSGKNAPVAAASPAPSAGALQDAGAGAVDAAVEHPLAGTTLEATQLVDKAIDAKQGELTKCVTASRTRRKDARAKIVLDIGIDQEGTLIGVKLPKGSPPDDELVACALAALRTAPFPRSHAGVLTVKRTFEEVTVYR